MVQFFRAGIHQINRQSAQAKVGKKYPPLKLHSFQSGFSKKPQSCIKIFKFFVSVLHFKILITGSKSVKFAQKFCTFLKFLTLEQGWAIISADGPHVGRPSPSRAELLDERKRAQ